MRSTLFMPSSSSVPCRVAQFMSPTTLSDDVTARPARPEWEMNIDTKRAVASTTDCPMSSRRMDSQRLQTWMGHHTRALALRRLSFVREKSACTHSPNIQPRVPSCCCTAASKQDAKKLVCPCMSKGAPAQDALTRLEEQQKLLEGFFMFLSTET